MIRTRKSLKEEILQLKKEYSDVHMALIRVEERRETESREIQNAMDAILGEIIEKYGDGREITIPIPSVAKGHKIDATKSGENYILRLNG